ncbi:MAG: hypothetical protein EXQ87_10340 [Alphaproteobacteria bacterium]|nr:hypothetical protein [Alphaproteobacteria bacterium]
MTAKKLTPRQVQHFRDDGFLAPIAALSPAEAAALRAKLEAYEATLSPGYDERMVQRKLHVRLPWMRAHKQCYRRYNEGYREQIERHARAFQ